MTPGKDTIGNLCTMCNVMPREFCNVYEVTERTKEEKKQEWSQHVCGKNSAASKSYTEDWRMEPQFDYDYRTFAGRGRIYI